MRTRRARPPARLSARPGRVCRARRGELGGHKDWEYGGRAPTGASFVDPACVRRLVLCRLPTLSCVLADQASCPYLIAGGAPSIHSILLGSMLGSCQR